MFVEKIYKNLTPSIANWYFICANNEFAGSDKTLTNIWRLNEWNGTKTGNLPTNSGTIPNLIKSPWSASENNLSRFSLINWWSLSSFVTECIKLDEPK